MSAAAPPGPAPWRGRVFASLRLPLYRRYFAGHVVSLLGFWMRVIVQGWLVYQLTGSKAVLGAVTAAGLIPFGVLSPVGGLLGDRVNRRRLLVLGQSVGVLANLALGVLILTGDVRLAHVVVAAVVVGATRAVEIPVRNAFVRDLVGREHLRNAIALNAAGFNVARVLGPALGGGLLLVLGMGPCFLAVAACGATMVWALLGIRVEETRHPSTSGPGRQLLEGLGYVRRHRRTRVLMLLVAITFVCTWAYQTQMPAFAESEMGMSEAGYALMMAVAGAGALLGALWVAGRVSVLPSRRGVVFGLVWAGSGCVLGLAFVRDVAAVLPLLAATGFCQVAFVATANGMVQESVPDALRARVMGLWAFVFGAAFPLGSALVGVVSETLGIREAWAGGAVLTILLSGLVRLRLPPRPRPAARPPDDERAVASAGLNGPAG